MDWRRSCIWLLVAVFQWASAECRPTLLTSSCPRCCAILFSSASCAASGELDGTFLVKEGGNGVLGAIWDDVPRAAIVRSGCLLEAWDWKNQTGPKRAFGLDGMAVYQLERYAFEGRISSLKCTCQTPPNRHANVVVGSLSAKTTSVLLSSDETDEANESERTDDDDQAEVLLAHHVDEVANQNGTNDSMF